MAYTFGPIKIFRTEKTTPVPKKVAKKPVKKASSSRFVHFGKVKEFVL